MVYLGPRFGLGTLTSISAVQWAVRGNCSGPCQHLQRLLPLREEVIGGSDTIGAGGLGPADHCAGRQVMAEHHCTGRQAVAGDHGSFCSDWIFAPHKRGRREPLLVRKHIMPNSTTNPAAAEGSYRQAFYKFGCHAANKPAKMIAKTESDASTKVYSSFEYVHMPFATNAIVH